MISYDIHNFPFMFEDDKLPLRLSDTEYISYFMCDPTRPLELNLPTDTKHIVTLEIDNKSGKAGHIYYNITEIGEYLGDYYDLQ